MDDGLIQRAPMNAQNMQREISTEQPKDPLDTNRRFVGGWKLRESMYALRW